MEPLEERTCFAFTEFLDPNPAGGNRFGETILPLTTGNVVITAPGDDFNGANTGAVYLFNGSTGALISTLRGSTAEDQIGTVVNAVGNGNFVVQSPSWDRSASADAGAVTWGSGVTGVSGIVSTTNSLVGSSTNDGIGMSFSLLSNGNYVVQSSNWDNGAIVDAGATTWGNGAGGTFGVVGSSNSLVGTTASDQVGGLGVKPLTNGNYLVISSLWNNGTVVDAGAVTWGNGTTGTKGNVSAANSLVGSTTNDYVGLNFGNGVTVTTFAGGNYVVVSPYWNNGVVSDAGAATWGNGATGISGVISSANSLVGSSPDDYVGAGGVTALTNGNYVVQSFYWNNAGTVDVGGVTWGNGTTGVSGSLSAANSLIGSTAGDMVGSRGVTALASGNYVVQSTRWDNGAAVDAGAVTWRSGTVGTGAVVSSVNSLVGSTTNDFVGEYLLALSNGNYVVGTPSWNNGATADVGAATWGNGATGVVGAVSAANSLVGTVTGDSIGSSGALIAVGASNYVVSSTLWNNGALADAGAATWGNGATGIVGAVSAVNSLVGSAADDRVGFVTKLANGNYVVRSTSWDNGAVVNAGAVTWGNGATGVSGAVSAANSLVGSSASDMSGAGFTLLSDGDYVISSPNWDNGAVANVGAATWGSGAAGISGPINAANSLIGSTTNDQVGYAILELSNGNFLVESPFWDNGAITDAGAVTWGNGTSGIHAVTSAANSLVGTTTNGSIGGSGVVALSNGNYVVPNPFWHNGALTYAGAATWGNGATGISGASSSGNSIVGLAGGGGLGGTQITVDNVNGTFFASFVNEDGGHVRVGSQSLGALIPPSDLSLSALVTPEMKPIGTTVGAFTTTDQSLSDSFTYSLVAGAGDTDNVRFTIVGNQLRTARLLDFEAAATYSVRVRTVDQAGFALEKSFTVSITDVGSTYIDDDWSALANGTVIADADPGRPGAQSATFGTNAFATLQSAVNATDANATIVVSPGTYGAAVALDRALTWETFGTVTVGGVVSGAFGLTKAGTGTLVLSGANTFSGSVAVTRGKLQIDTDARLGAATNDVNVDPLGELVFTDNTTSSRVFNLSSGALTLNANVFLFLSGAAIGGGFIKGPGAVQTTPGVSTSFIGTTLRPSTSVTVLGPDVLSNVSNGGLLDIAEGQTVVLDGLTNESGGWLYVEGVAQVSDLITYGQITAAGTITNVGGTEVSFGGGSSSVINDGGSIDVGAAGAVVTGGLVKNFGDFGSAAGNVVVDYGGKVTGPGTFHSVGTTNGGVYSPGASPGGGNLSSFPINGGGTFQFEISNATGAAGNISGWDRATVAPNVFSPTSAQLLFTATATNPYTILVDSRLNDGAGNTVGTAANFNPNGNYSWKFVDGNHPNTTVSGVFDPTAFNIVTSGFQNVIDGEFSVTTADGGKSLVLNYAANLNTLHVASFAATATGASFTLSQAAVVTSGLNLYDYRDGSGASVLGAADVQLVGPSGAVPGSLMFDATSTSFAFVATAGGLSAGSYTFTLRSAANGFRTAVGDLLDGNSDGTAGDNYVNSFTVTVPASNAITISLPNFARGPEQAVNMPADATAGLPLHVSDGGGLTAMNFELAFDPGLLNITAISLVGGGTANLTPVSPGRVQVALTFATPLASGAQTVAYLTAAVPTSAASRYGEREVLDISALSLTTAGGSVPGIDRDAVHVNAYFADAGRNGKYDSFDVQQASRMALRLDTGFQQHPLLDPTILADFNNNGRIDSFDVQQLSRLALRLPVSGVAALPSPAPTTTDTDRLTAEEPPESEPAKTEPEQPIPAPIAPRSDIDGSGDVDAQDVAWAIYYFNRSSNGQTPAEAEGKQLDLNGDQSFDSADVLLAVSDLNAKSASMEGEFTAPSTVGADLEVDLDALTCLLAEDLVATRKKK